ncbi:MAG: response regulator [Deltaproteobacteria bacterium]|nr:response regulator [Deltaproteobacteria bacterium]
MKILLAEDNLVNQKVAMGLLDRWGYEADLAPNGLEALNLWRSHDYDLILMDLQMPKMSGFECARAIRLEELAKGSHIPIVALTAHAMRGDRERCLNAGMDAYVPKPINPEELKQILEEFHVHKSPRLVKQTKFAYSLAEIASHLGGDLDLAKDVIRVFLKEYPKELSKFQQSYEKKDFEQIKQLAFRLKGGLVYFGAEEIQASAALVETKAKEANLEELKAALKELQSHLEELGAYLRSLQ